MCHVSTWSGWPAHRTMQALRISRRSYYPWLKEEKSARAWPEVKPVQMYEELPAEKVAVLNYPRAHPELRTLGAGTADGR